MAPQHLLPCITELSGTKSYDYLFRDGEGRVCYQDTAGGVLLDGLGYTLPVHLSWSVTRRKLNVIPSSSLELRPKK